MIGILGVRDDKQDKRCSKSASLAASRSLRKVLTSRRSPGLSRLCVGRKFNGETLKMFVSWFEMRHRDGIWRYQVGGERREGLVEEFIPFGTMKDKLLRFIEKTG